MSTEEHGREPMGIDSVAEVPTEAPPPIGRETRPGCLHYGLFVLVSLWVLAVTFGAQVVAWVIGQVLLIQEEPMPSIDWVIITWVQALLLLLPLLPLALLTRPPRLRATYRTWTTSAAFILPLALIRLIPNMRTEAAALAQAVVALIALAFVRGMARRRGYGFPRSRGAAVALAVALAALMAAPWAVMGALGSPVDTVLAFAAGLAFGSFAALLLAAFLFTPLAATPGRDVLFGGFAAGTALAILASGFGFEGNQLLLMASLPSLGFALAALGRYSASPNGGPSRGWLPLAVLIGVLASAVLAFFDPKELTLLLDQGFSGDVPTWAAAASGTSILLGWLSGFLSSIMLRRSEAERVSSSPFGLAAAGTWVGLLLLYFLVGQPGFFGEGLFVVFRDQADLSAASSIAVRNQRISYVYQKLAQEAEATQAPLRADLDRLRIAYRPYYLVNAMEVQGGPLVRLYLSGRPEVDRVLDNPWLRPLPESVPVAVGSERAPSSPPWNITSIGAERVWKELGVTGKGIVVGQSDSGVDGSHPALRPGYRGLQSGNDYNWLDPWNHTTSPTDRDGHGTHTLGSILGRGGIGVAPDAEWFGCVNLARNLGNPSVYLNCMQFMLAPYPQGGDPFKDGDPSKAAHVTNNSWGCPSEEGCDATSLLQAAKALRAAGIFEAVSAGNSGPRCDSVLDPLAIYSQVFTVGAFGPSGNIASFSSRGPVTVDGSGRIKPDIIAPGEQVISSFPRNSYKTLEGTSMAGPHVAGVVALMWSAQPKLIGDIDRTEQILRDTAKPYTGRRQGCFQGGVPNDAYGYGMLDAYAAVKAAQALK